MVLLTELPSTRTRTVTFAILLSLGVAGCLSSADPARELDLAGGDLERPVVVALVDSGINPYHVAFRTPEAQRAPLDLVKSSFLDTRTGASPVAVDLTFDDDFDRAFAADEGIWSRLEPETLYAFPGTNVMGISFFPAPDNAVYVLDSGIGHGTGTSSVVAETAPGVILVMVEESGSVCKPSEAPCVLDPFTIKAMEWVAAQPWIDVVSLSLGTPANAPSPEADRFAAATRSAAAAGKIVVTAAGNTVVPALVDGLNGPPWAITTGGVTYPQQGETIGAGKLPDVVANYTARVAVHGLTQEKFSFSGTSYAAPRVAGVLAHALGDVRRAWGHPGGIADGALARSPTGDAVGPRAFRDALNASALYWGSEQWDPTKPALDDPVRNLFASSAPVVGAAPYVQMGWGYVDNATVPLIVQRVLAGDDAVPPEKTQAAEWMDATYAAREAYWRARLG